MQKVRNRVAKWQCMAAVTLPLYAVTAMNPYVWVVDSQENMAG